jgi:hypothetical protein
MVNEKYFVAKRGNLGKIEVSLFLYKSLFLVIICLSFRGRDTNYGTNTVDLLETNLSVEISSKLPKG